MPAKKTTATAKTTTKTATPKKEPAVEVEIEKSEPIIEKKQFKDDDKIQCMSITAGKYVFVGDKSGEVYRWLSDGDVVDVRYSDLVAAVRAKKPIIFKPRVIIEDEDFIAEYPAIQELYDSLYSPEDLFAICQMSPSDIRRIVPQLPDGVKESLKTIAVKAIDDGKLDSVQRVRALDQIFGTDMLLKLTT